MATVFMYSRSTSTRSTSAVQVIQDEDALSMGSTQATNTTSVLPALTDASSTDSSEGSSIDTGMASSVLGDGFILESQDGVLQVPFRYHENADLWCPFQILDCEHIFDDIVPFKTHVFSHFRGHELPTLATCFLCGDKFSNQPDTDADFAWNTMLSHMVHEHFRQGQQLATVRTDFVLMKWMHARKIISDAEFKRTQLLPVHNPHPRGASRRRPAFNIPELPRAPSASPPASVRLHLRQTVGYQNEPYTMIASRRQDRRRLDATRNTIRARNVV